MKTQTEYIEKLKTLKGQEIRLVNVADAEMEDGRMQIHVHGKMDVVECEDGETDFYVRVKECAGGSSGVTFRAKHVESIDKQFYCWLITLH
jgi:hypothetical protein